MLEGIFKCKREREDINSLDMYVDIHEPELITEYDIYFTLHGVQCGICMMYWHVWMAQLSTKYGRPLYPACFTMPVVAVDLYLIME